MLVVPLGNPFSITDCFNPISYLNPVNEPLTQGQMNPPPINREAVTEQIGRICDLLPPESLLEILNFAIHELVHVLQNQTEEDR
ncbi:hypothetical protein [Gloeomargarita lithophora]|uniref:hypothetical protein n=1 Tax=Gloeomargarita lithophora TaxID=1188228 RepID=UPI0008F815FB|nr:hypothetical protein [Gloeomargarita lithophora]